MLSNYSTVQIEAAIDAACLSPKELHWLQTLLKMQTGTTWECAKEAGYIPSGFDERPDDRKNAMKNRWNVVMGGICHKLADQLQYKRDLSSDQKYWTDLAVTWETLDEDAGFMRWVLRPGWVNVSF